MKLYNFFLLYCENLKKITIVKLNKEFTATVILNKLVYVKFVNVAINMLNLIKSTLKIKYKLTKISNTCY